MRTSLASARILSQPMTGYLADYGEAKKVEKEVSSRRRTSMLATD